MVSKMFLLFAYCIFFLGCSSKKASATNDVAVNNCEVDIAAIIDTAFRNTGDNFVKNHQEKVVTWSEFFDTTLIKKLNFTPCRTKRSSDVCTVDSFELYSYNRTVFIEYGESATLYTLYKDFPTTPNGISAGFTKEQVVAILGKPIHESDNQFQYDTGEYNNIILYFKENKLHIICYADRSGDCME